MSSDINNDLQKFLSTIKVSNDAKWTELAPTVLAGLTEAMLRLVVEDEPAVYRFPVTVTELHQAIGGRRHGADRRLQVSVERTVDALKIMIETPKHAQLELGCPGRVKTTAQDFDERGNLRKEAVARMINELTGPMVSRIGHVAFNLAFKHARLEGRTPDGRFWFAPSEIATLLGYKPERSRSRRGHTKDTVKRIRRDFETYANTVLRQTWKGPDGKHHTVDGTLLYPTKKTHTARTPGKAGRDKRVEFQIRPELWKLTRSWFVVIPEDLLDARDARPHEWAKCIRVYEVLASHARNNARHALTDGEWVLTLDKLIEISNLFSSAFREREARQETIGYLEKLAARHALDFKLDHGRVRYTLPAERVAELRLIGSKRNAHLENGGKVPRLGVRNGGKVPR